MGRFSNRSQLDLFRNSFNGGFSDFPRNTLFGAEPMAGPPPADARFLNGAAPTLQYNPALGIFVPQ